MQMATTKANLANRTSRSGLRDDKAGARLAVVKSAKTLLWRMLLFLIGIDVLTSQLIHWLGRSDSVWLDALEYLLMAVVALPVIYWLTLRPLANLATEQAELAGEARFKTIANASREGILITDRLFRIRFANQAAAEIFGMNAGKLIEIDLRELVSAEASDFLSKQITRFQTNPDAVSFESGNIQIDGRRSDDRLFPLELTISVLPDKSEKLYFVILRDITERKLAEQFLRESEAQFRMLADSVPMSIWLENPKGECTYVNQTWLTLTGCRIEKELGMGWREHVHPDDLGRTCAVFEAAHREQLPLSTEYRLRAKDGQFRWMADRGQPRFAPDGKYLGHIGACFDITERKLAEEALRESEAKFRALTETTASGILIIDSNGKCLYSNPTVHNFTGYSEKEFQRMNMIEVVHPDHRQMVLDHWTARLAGRSAPSRYELKIVHKDGRTLWVNFAATSIQFDGKPAILATAADITDLKQAEENLWERTLQLNALAENSPLGIVTVNREGKVTLCNPAFEQMFQYTLSEIVGADLDSAIVPPHLLGQARELTAQASSGRRFQIITERRRRDGSLLDVEMFAVPLVVDGETVGGYGIYQDLTSRRDLENAIRESEERYRRIFEQANDAIVLVDPATRCLVDANQRAMETYHLDRSGISRMCTEQLGSISEESRTKVEALDQGGPPVSFEGTYTNAEGKQIAHLVNASMVDYGGKRVVMAIMRDITERKHMEAALQESEARFRMVADSVPILMWMLDENARLLFSNKESLEFTGLTLTELRAGAWVGLIHPDDLARATQLFAEKMRTHEPYSQEYRVRRHDGEYRWVYEYSRPRFDAHGEFSGFTGCVVDSTERRIAEDKVLASEKRLRMLLDALPVAVRIVQDGRVAFANPEDARMHGYASPEEEIGTTVLDYIAPEDRSRVLDLYERRTHGKEAPRRYTARRLRRDGSSFLAELTIERVEFEGQPVSLIAIQDLTDRERIELYEKLLPVCCVCGKIRDDQGGEKGGGNWQRLDQYVALHSDAQISHTFCPHCLEEYKKKEGLA
jgi:PAS domain S-box-containing protein